MSLFKGGRGKYAPYKTDIVRVPQDIKPQVEAIANTFRELKLLGKEDEIQKLLDRVESAIVSTAYKNSTQLPSYEQARELANKVINQKQAAKKSIEKLLQLLYNIDNTKEVKK
jgi:hypothetical protein